jgi:hypothetical protein
MKTLAEQSQSQSEGIEKMTAKATRDAAAVKVLTVVTLVYLPATAVLVSCQSSHLPLLRPFAELLLNRLRFHRTQQ